tara:strand:+ start:1052 stop:1165 length:114 start_codon:yes stop_codon:yes gene_type:complete
MEDILKNNHFNRKYFKKANCLSFLVENIYFVLAENIL